ncbi:MAG TPA: amidase [Gemmatimonadaceae bacterium]|nr:amidase [Gemmatimonadaceae bacterium]
MSKRPGHAPIERRDFLRAGALAALATTVDVSLAESRPSRVPATSKPHLWQQSAFDLEETTIAALQEGMRSGRDTALSIAERYLTRMDAIDKSGPAINAVIERNPDAIQIAEERDAERKAGRVRGPLHGIPVLIKDNIDTADRMRTSAGSLALAESIAPRDAFIAARLREAGAVILGKTNLSEWANFRSTRSTSGWSGRGGQTKNPYALDRNPCGSSSGTGASISANLAAVGVGTETDGSIVCPSSANGLVGIKPTVGLVSRSGIIPISHSQDTAGPMARTVADAAELLAVLSGVDPRDPATAASRGKVVTSYTNALNPGALKGVRIGVARNFFGFSTAVDRIMDEAIAAMKSAGAIIVDPANITTSGKFDDAEGEVLNFEFKADLNAYLATLGPSAPHKTLADLIAFNDQNADREMPFFGQEQFLRAQAKGPLTSPAYKAAREKCVRLSRTEGIDATLAKHRVVAVVAPTGGPAWTTDLINGDHFTGASSTPAAVSGYPSVTVPAGYVHGLPVGISFIGAQWSDGTLIGLAYAFEQATKVRRPPRFEPTVKL